ncbi:MAG: hypothetical protein NC344_04930 [Bacteroidales bacterium]|nr:hypothetical protein [Bacteroidales bacterium]MCM1147170.1 hypothetical protein [Bacteroidales bacterium]MCM1205396.1 hypothetical protein [Bacillota bacterium]MCM1509799.1 hypothetical protein [Clostridium sp.]
MKKILLSFVAIMVTMSAFAELKTATFDFSNPESCGWTGGNKAIGDGVLAVGDVTITVAKDATSALQKVRFAATAGVVSLKYGTGCALSVKTGVGNIRVIKVNGENVAKDDVTVTEGTWAAGQWSGQATEVILTQAGAAATVNSIEVVYQIADKEDDFTLGETESYVAVTATPVEADGTTKWEYAFSPEFASPVLTEGACTVSYGTAHITAESVASATAKTCDATGVTEWNDMKFDLKNHLNDNTSNLHYGIAVGTGNPVFGYEIEEVWKDGVSTGTWRQTFNKKNPAYDPAEAYLAGQKGEQYDEPQYLEMNYYYWKPGCGQLPGQGLYHKFTSNADGQLKLFVWVNKGNRNTFLIDEETKDVVPFKVEGYMNNQTNEDGTKKLLTNADIEVLNDPAKPYVIAGTQAGSQPFWGNIIYNIKKGQTVWLFQDSSQIGFHGFEFAPIIGTGIQNVEAVENATVAPKKVVKNGQIMIGDFNIAGQRVK